MALFGRGKDLEQLLKRLESKGHRGPREKRELLAELAEFGAELKAEVLVRFLVGGDSDLGRFALDQIGQRKDRRLLEMLLSNLERAPRARWRPLLLAVHRVGAPELPERLGQMIRSKRTETREAALEVIGADTDWKRHLSLLRKALRDEETVVRVRAVRLLGGDTRDDTIRNLLRELMYANDDAVREAAIEVLAREPHADLIEDFFDLLPNVSARLQDEILRGLKRMLAAHDTIPENVLERLLPLLAADDARIREAAAKLLAGARDKLAVLRRFCQYAKGIAFWLRDRAFRAISSVADDLTEAVLTLLTDEDLDVIVGAIAMIRGTQDRRLVEGLGHLLDGDRDWWIKIPALEKLAEFRDPEVTRILVWKLDDSELRTAALACLGERAEPETLKQILRFLDHDERGIRRTALSALERFEGTTVLHCLDQVARSDPDTECRIVALEMLDKLGGEGEAAAESIRRENQSMEKDVVAGLALDMVRPAHED